MKNYFLSISVLTLLLSSAFTLPKRNLKDATFKVWGNCGMCEEKIEQAADMPGVIQADWSQQTLLMNVTYNEDKITIDQIQQAIASVGYDTERFKASDEAYKSLHGCCQYDREK